MTYNKNIIEMAHVLSYCEEIGYGSEALERLENKYGDVSELDSMLCIDVEDEIQNIVIELAGEYEIWGIEKQDVAQIIFDFAFNRYNKFDADYHTPFYYDREGVIKELQFFLNKIDF